MTQPEQNVDAAPIRNFNLGVMHQASRSTREMMEVGEVNEPRLELGLEHLVALVDRRDPLMAVMLSQDGQADRGVIMIQSDLRGLPAEVRSKVLRPRTPEANAVASRLLRNRDPGVALRALVYLATHAEIHETHLAVGVIHHRAGNHESPNPFL